MTSVSYESHPYPRLAFPYSQPEHLATIARLFGLEPAPPETCRVLEFGCARGANLVPLADAAPGSGFVGIDSSPGQIDEARRFATGAGVGNVEFHDADLRTLDDSLGSFDYVIAHGVYSWVPDDVKDRLLEVTSRLLAPGGIAYFSYSTYPGCRLREPVRELCLFHARQNPTSESDLDAADRLRRFLQFMLEALPAGDAAYQAAIHEQVQLLLESDDAVLLHDLLEADNDPVYFRQFVAHVDRHGLQYLGEAWLNTMFGAGIAPHVLEKLRESSDLIEFEQYLDYVYGRSLRTTLVCHRQLPIDRQVTPERLDNLLLVSQAKPVTVSGKPVDPTDVKLEANLRQHFAAPDATLQVDEPLAAAALIHLGEIFPCGATLSEVVTAAAERAGDRTIASDIQRASLAEHVLSWYVNRVVELHAWLPEFTTTPSDRPQTSRVARYQVSQGWDVVNRLHKRVSLPDPFARSLLELLDGTRDRASLTLALARPVLEGKFALRIDGQSVTEPAKVRGLVADRVESTLAHFARHALLVR